MGVKLAAASGGSIELVPINTASNFTVTVPAVTAAMAIDGPAFSARNTASQTGITNAVSTKVLFPSEDFDTNGCFSSSTFTPTIAGYYQINACLDIGSSVIGTALSRIYKNGSLNVYGTGVNGAALSEVYLTAAGLVYCNGTTDYIEIYVYMSTTSNIVYSGSTFSAAMVRGA
jgi:hypothetical protein